MEQRPTAGKPPIIFSVDQIALINEMAAVLTKEQLSDLLGVCSNTFRAIEERQPEVAKAFRAGKSRAIAKIGANLIAQAEAGNLTAAMFYLRTQAGWTENNARTIEPTKHVIHIVRPDQPSDGS